MSLHLEVPGQDDALGCVSLFEPDLNITPIRLVANPVLGYHCGGLSLQQAIELRADRCRHELSITLSRSSIVDRL